MENSIFSKCHLRKLGLFATIIVSLMESSHPALLSFKFTEFNFSTPNIEFQGFAALEDGYINLTRDHVSSDTCSSIGRATYSEPLHLYNSETGEFANFSTHFAFVIDTQNQILYGDGLTFFLAPIDYRIPDCGVTLAGFLGLTRVDPSSVAPGSAPTGVFVAVEFDTFTNLWDPPFAHVGIDVLSLNSSAQTEWDHPISKGLPAEAWISYDSRASLLSVNFTNIKDGDTHEFRNISLPVNLSQVLPEWIVVGFTATTGGFTELHKILSWEFSTNSVDLPVHGRDRNRRVLVLWLGIGAGTLGSGLLVVWFLSRRKRVRNGGNDVIELDETDDIDNDFRKSAGPMKFSYHELSIATNNFDEKGKLGQS